MALLLLGMVLFFVPHFLGILGLKNGLKQRLGEGPFKGIYSLLSLAGIVLIVMGYRDAPFDPVYTPMEGRAVPHALMPFAVILAAGANMKSNLKQFIRHPMALAVLLWSISHLSVRGDLASLMVFGAFGIFAILNMTLTKAAPLPPTQPRAKDVMLVVAGLVGYGAIAWLHGAIGGVPVMG